MNKIEEEIFEAFLDVKDPENELESYAKIASEIARKWIIKAVEDTKGYRTDVEYVSGKSIDEWLKDNNL